MKRGFNFWLLQAMSLVVLLKLFSCTPVVYTAVGHSASLLEKKGQGRVSGGLASMSGGAFSNSAVSVFGNFSIAASDHTVITASYYGGSAEAYDWNSKLSYFEFGVGRFGKMDAKNAIGEIIIGSGFGSYRNSNTDGSVFDVTYVKPFIQPAIGVRKENFEFAFTPRIGLVKYTSVGLGLVDTDDALEYLGFLQDHARSMVVEPGVTLRAGGENLKLTLQVSTTMFDFGGVDSDTVLGTYIGFGVDYSF